MKSGATWRPQDLFPLGGSSIGMSQEPDATLDAIRPFGLRYLTEPAASGAEALDLGTVRFDPDRQIAVTAEGGTLTPTFRHTNSRTQTTTNVDDRKAPDSDTDYEQDR